MRVVKTKLLEVLPDIKCFLDVDDLKEGRGREYVEQSHTVCIFVSNGYFQSCNCMREFLRAVSLGKQIISLVESERNKGALTPSEVLDRLIDAEILYDRWGLTAEFASWGWTKPSPQELYNLLCLEVAPSGQRDSPTLDGARSSPGSPTPRRAWSPRIGRPSLPRRPRRWVGSSMRGFCKGRMGPTGTGNSDLVSTSRTLVSNVQAAVSTTRSLLSPAKRIKPYTGAIYWERLTDFQNVTIRLVCERLLRTGGTVYYGELSRERPRLQPPQHRLSYHMYCSAHNARALDIVTEVAATLDAKLTRTRYIAPPKEKESRFGRWNTRDLRNSRRNTRDITEAFSAVANAANALTQGDDEPVKKSQIHVTRDARQLAACEHMLLYLHRETWTSGPKSAALALEVKQAMALGVHVLLVHEMPGVESERRHGVDFGAFFECAEGATPEALLAAGIYSEIALALKGGAWREVSLLQMATALSAGVPFRGAPRRGGSEGSQELFDLPNF